MSTKNTKGVGTDLVDQTWDPTAKGIILPILNGVPMTKVEASKLLLLSAKDDETVVAPKAKFNFTVHEGRVAVARVRAQYGQSLDKAQVTMFGEIPPGFERVVINEHGDELDVPTGVFEIPGLEGQLACSSYFRDDGQILFMLAAKLKKRYLPIWERFCDEVKEEVESNSIYLGKVFEIDFIETKVETEEGERVVTMPTMPRYLRLPTTPAEPIFDAYLKRKLDMNTVWMIENPALHLEVMGQLGHPPSRKVCMFGKPGCGKTLQVLRVAQAAQRTGTTYIRSTAGRIAETLSFAKRFQDVAKHRAVCVEIEDIDRSATSGERTAAADRILNMVDGSVSKEDFLLLLMTSNNIDEMDAAATRSGRMDVLVEIEPPTGEAAITMIERTLGVHLDPSTKLDEVARFVAGWMPASITELCAQGRHIAIHRTGDLEAQVTAEDLLTEIRSGHIAKQVKRSLKEKEVKRTAIERAAQTMGDAIREAAEVDAKTMASAGTLLLAHESAAH